LSHSQKSGKKKAGVSATSRELKQMESNEAGKGDTPRPRQISAEEWAANWERAFGEAAKDRDVLIRLGLIQKTRARKAKTFQD
jgi:hypothetical protein